ncbi:diguanylate cyclase [Xylophilus rhododendri]|uniref:Diguanylate cyclase n=1 Tax=Xylophilus rhododendri TaxID=2697032 RepID=A0A857JCC5_9BURK|nr:GGDEF domain-containing protein [Xylophilus rhododendri]QHJ01661.1 diguanylate cyclase [Xylophilus rhododendri]
MFDLAPVSLWLEDFSGLKKILDGWRAEGVVDLRTWLEADPARRHACMASLRVLRVNQRTLQLFGAATQEMLLARLADVFRGDMADSVINELCQLWRGALGFENQTVNYTLDGRRLDVLVRARVLPGHESDWDRVLISLEDTTSRLEAQRVIGDRERYARSLFEHSPVSLWVEDFSSVKRLIDEARDQGISDFATFIKVHPEFVTRCMQEIRVVDVNHETLRMFGARSKDELLRNTGRIFRDEMHESFSEQLRELWVGKTLQQREVVNYSLTGELVNIHMQFAVMEGHQDRWDMVLVSLVDITARKKAEAYLEYLGKHDVLTQLRNRTFYTEELARLARKGPWPLSVLAIDMNGLKLANDEFGHAAGDGLLRRIGEVLTKAVDLPSVAARIGGDEFAVIMPGIEDRGAENMKERIEALLEMNNQFYGGERGLQLSLSIGIASCHSGDQIESMLLRADKAMYVEKARHYSKPGAPDRRRG